jgi:hypothetical protein
MESGKFESLAVGISRDKFPENHKEPIQARDGRGEGQAFSQKKYPPGDEEISSCDPPLSGVGNLPNNLLP